MFEAESPRLLLFLVLIPAAFIVLRVSLVDSPRAQLFLSAVTRCLILLLLILALVGILWVKKSRDLSVLVLADMSDSVPENAPKQLETFLGLLEERLPGGSSAGLVVFACSPTIEVPLDSHPKFAVEVEKQNEGGGDTSIEKALVLASESMPFSSINRVVLFTDGNETTGDALTAAKRAAKHGFRIYTFPYEMAPRDEVLLEDLLVPTEVKKGQSFSVSAVAHAVSETTATFTLYRDGFKTHERDVLLEPGRNNFTFQESNPQEGLTKYELHVRAGKDFFVDNNIASGVVFISGEPKILLMEGKERNARFLARALEAENIRVEIREGKGMPGTLDELAAYDAVIFSDVPATDLSTSQMSLLRSYVEDLGGGFIMVGGEESFGLGGYYRTAVEEILPVRVRSEKRKDTPSLAMMLIIDKSGSMQGLKVELAKEAAIATVELLTDRDYVGVVAFDAEPYWVVDLQSAGNRHGIVQTISSLDAEGGTNIYPALEESYAALSQVSAAFKHCILLTDGISQPGDFAGIVDRMAAEMITVSTVGIGEEADADLLQSIARWGRGRYYFTADAFNIPQIFTKETMTASKSSLVEEPFVPQLYRTNQVVRSIDWQSAPFLFGYVVTTPKATADVPLLTERGDPLLATWRYGLGKCVAFTSDAKSRWAADWIRWPGYAQFWAQLVRDTMRISQNRGAETSIAFRADQATITIDNTNDAGQFINGLISNVQCIRPDLSMKTLPLEQTAPGRYESSFSIEDAGSYLLRIQQQQIRPNGENETISDYTRGLTISYKPEYRHLSINEDFLKQLAAVTGGKCTPTFDEIFSVSENDAVQVRKKLWPWLLAAALLLFLLDVALRRIDLAGRNFFSKPRRYG
ncbi:MAG: VWA domain-containing protein [bacterium]